ncbi:hypothetical protein Esti_004583 [Eimeria stiedai]
MKGPRLPSLTQSKRKARQVNQQNCKTILSFKAGDGPSLYKTQLKNLLAVFASVTAIIFLILVCSSVRSRIHSRVATRKLSTDGDLSDSGSDHLVICEESGEETTDHSNPQSPLAPLKPPDAKKARVEAGEKLGGAQSSFEEKSKSESDDDDQPSTSAGRRRKRRAWAAPSETSLDEDPQSPTRSEAELEAASAVLALQEALAATGEGTVVARESRAGSPPTHAPIHGPATSTGASQMSASILLQVLCTQSYFPCRLQHHLCQRLQTRLPPLRRWVGREQGLVQVPLLHNRVLTLTTEFQRIVAALQVLWEPACRPWWNQVRNVIRDESLPETAYVPSRNASPERFHVDLMKRLHRALRILKTGRRLSKEVTIEIKNMIFCCKYPPTPFKHSRWDPWKADDRDFGAAAELLISLDGRHHIINVGYPHAALFDEGNHQPFRSAESRAACSLPILPASRCNNCISFLHLYCLAYAR